MKVIEKLDHLNALPLLVIVRAVGGQVRSRSEDAKWHQMGAVEEIIWTEDDLPAKVVWDYAQEVGDPTTEALAQLGVAMLNQQLQKQQDAPQPQGAPIANGQAPAEVAPPLEGEVIVPGEVPQPVPPTVVAPDPPVVG